MPRYDEAIARWAAGLHSNDGLNSVMLGITRFGEEILLIGAFALLTLVAYRRRGPAWGRFIGLVGLGAVALDNVIKPLVGRSRPAFDQLVGGRGDSFPSGHVLGTTALFFALAWYFSHGRAPDARRFAFAAAAAGAVTMAASRIYLGVHWPTDVLGGLVLGAAWTMMSARSQLNPTRSRPPRTPLIARRRTVPAIVALAAMGLACSPSSRSSAADENPVPAERGVEVTTDPYGVDIQPEDFVGRVDNPYFPLVPGTVYKLKGSTEDGIEMETIKVLDRTKEVMGIETTVVKDVARVDGEIAEFTYDWYAQDVAGNVWYFGENTAEMEDGVVVNRHGSWKAGVDGAQPGIIMNAEPQVLDSYRQEYYAGEAEDMYWIVATGEAVKTPAGTFDEAIRALEWNPLEPGVVGQKFYAPGVGLVAERALSGGKEVVELLEVVEP